MKTFKVFLLERSPEQLALSKDKSVIDYLLSCDPKTTYFTFTNVHKLGINPINRYYETPIGIYSYPLQYYFDSIKKTKDFSSIPFQSKAEFICVFIVKDTSKRIIHFDSYSEDDFKEDLKSLESIYSSMIINQSLNHGEEREKEREEKKARVKSFLSFIEDKLKKTPFSDPAYKKLKQESWRTEILLKGLDSQGSNVEKSFKHVVYGFIIGKGFREKEFKSWDEFSSFILDTYKLNKEKPASKLFSFTQILSLYLTEKSLHSNINTTKWRSILFKDLEILGLIDPGYGIIHEKVKTQALWLNPKALIVLKIFENITPKTSSFHEKKIFSKDDILKLSEKEVKEIFNPSLSKKELINSLTKNDFIIHSDFVFKNKETLSFILNKLGLETIDQTSWKK